MGKILAESGKSIAALTTLSGTNMPTPQTVKSSTYTFGNLVKGANYTLTPARDTDWLNGVTTFDIALMSRHALDIDPITNPYKLIAGDVDRDGFIDASDLLQLRKLVLRQIPRITTNTAWRFVPKNHVFSTISTTVPTGFPENIALNNMLDTIKNADFVAVKTGDINQSANDFIGNTALETRSSRTWNLNIDDLKLEAGKIYEIPVSAQDFTLAAFQMTLNYDKNLIKLIGIEKADLDGFNASNYALFTEKGMATLSWHTDKKIFSDKNTAFKFTLQANKTTQLSDALMLTSDLTPTEAYNENGEKLNIKLNFKNANTEGGQFYVYPNYPNPFQDETTIRFQLPKADVVKLTVLDETGRIVKTVKKDFEKGINELNLDLKNMTNSSILFYKIETSTHSALQRLVILK